MAQSHMNHLISSVCNAPEICAEYGQKHDLPNEHGWKQFHHIAKL